MEVELHGALSVVNVPKCLCFTGLLAKHCNFLATVEPSKILLEMSSKLLHLSLAYHKKSALKGGR